MLDSRDLIQERDDLKEEILNDFNECFPQYEAETYGEILFEEEEIQSWAEQHEDSRTTIEEIDYLEIGICHSEWDYGLTLIPDDEFEDYVKELITDCGYISNDLPSWIEIDWETTAENVKIDYSEVEFRGKTYHYSS